MLKALTLLIWDGQYVIVDGEPTVDNVLSVEPLVNDLCNLVGDDHIDCRAYMLNYDTDEDADLEEDMDLISQNLADMLNDDTVVIAKHYELRLKGVSNRNLGIAQHITDLKRYYEKHPFIC